MPPTGSADKSHSWHLFILRLRTASLEITRSDFINQLKENGIGTSVHFIPLHLQPYYQLIFGYRRGDFPHAEDAYSRCVSLPIYPDMTDCEVERVMNTVEDIVVKKRRRVLVGAI